MLAAPPDLPVRKAELSHPLFIENLFRSKRSSGFYLSFYAVNDSMRPISLSLITLVAS
jgi:hypothetical protein